MTELSPQAVVAVYATTRDQLLDQVAALDGIEAKPVPSCPEWSVKDVIAHLSGLVADILAGVRGPLGSDEATTRQVGTRAAMSLSEVCEEWAGNADAVAPLLIDAPMRGLGLTADLAVHVHDLAEMGDGVTTPPVEATRLGCIRYVPLLQERAAEQMNLSLTATLDGQTWSPPAGSTALALQGSQVEFLRSVTGRRTRSQVEAAFTWEGDPTALLDQAFMQYGPFRPEA